jgi:uncharacterized membrane protein YkvA (DUF1232 family)
VRAYKSYLFKDKDPIIDRVRTLIADQDVSHQYIENRSGVCARTLYNWFHGETKRPCHATVAAVCAVLGYDLVPVKRVSESAKVVPIRKKS